jgi:hypothetical protein
MPPRGPRSVLCVVVVTKSAMRHRARVQAGCDQAGVRAPCRQKSSAPTVRDRAEARKSMCSEYAEKPATIIFGLCSCASARPARSRSPVVGVEAVLHRVVELAGEVDRRAVRQVPAVRQAHAEDGVARLQHRHVHGGVGLRARMRLHVGEIGAEQRLRRSIASCLGDVDVLAAAVVALARVALGVLVRQHGTLRLHHARARVVLRRDQLDVIFLACAPLPWRTTVRDRNGRCSVSGQTFGMPFGRWSRGPLYRWLTVVSGRIDYIAGKQALYRTFLSRG